MNKEFEEFINVKKSPISNCLDLSRYFIGRHNITPVYLTPQFEKEFNSKMYELEKLTKENQQLKEQLNKYTDPKDLTLMFMYCDEKAKDKIKCLEQENQQLKEQIEKCQLQNFNLKQDIMIKKISFPNKKIRDKSLIELYNMPSYEDLKRENQQLKEQLDQKEDIINKAKENLQKHLNAKNYGNHKYELFGREYLEELLEILDNKGE